MAVTTPSLSEHFDPKVLASLEGLDLKARYVMEGFLTGLHNSPFHGFSVEFSDYRNYQPGDDLRHLDWRLYARSDRLCIKRYMQETNARFYVICDTSASMRYRGASAWGSKLDCAKVLAAALTWFLLRQNDAAGMVTLSGPDAQVEFIRPSQKPNQFGVMLRQLDALQATSVPLSQREMARVSDDVPPVAGRRPVSPSHCLSALLQHTIRLVHRRSIILFFSDLLEPSAEVEYGFKQLRYYGHEVLVFQVLDRDELEFPFTESRVFEDLETGTRRVVDPAQARAHYLARFAQFMASYTELFRSLEIPHCTVRTDENPWQALALFLAQRQQWK